MKLINDNTAYGLIARIFHWFTFLILLIQLPLGVYLDNLEFSEFKLSVENIHVIIGLSVFYITLLRLLWKTYNVQPSSSSISKFQIIAGKATHWLFYITLLAITVSGILKLLLSGEEVNFIFFQKSIDYFNYDLADQFHVMHALSAYFLLIIFTIHLGAVVYHHIFQKDPILKRML